MKVIHLPETKGVGRLGRHVRHDPISKAFVFDAPGPLRSAKHHRYGNVLDQCDLGACTGFAMAGALMAGPLWSNMRQPLNETAAVQLYSMATTFDDIPGTYPPNDTGSSGLSVAKAAKRLSYLHSYHHAFGLGQALRALAAQPVLLGIPWYGGFDHPVGSECELRISGGIRGGHEVYLCEVDVENRYVRLVNSWGSGWGKDGTAVLSFRTLDTLLRSDGDVVVPVW